MNQVILKGNVGQEPTNKTLENGRKVMQLSVATSERWFDKVKNEWHESETQWHNVVAWGHLADKPVQKGHTVLVTGKVTYRSYMKDDEKRYVTDIVATDLDILVRYSKSQAPAPTKADDPKQKWSDGSAYVPPAPIGGDVPLPVDNGTPF